MKNTCLYITIFFPAVFFLTACEDKNLKSNMNDHVTSSATAPYVAIDGWVGKWDGPEGTFLQLAGGNGKYEIIIQNLDGPVTYHGIATDKTIQFERNGQLETIHATDGAGTGMKWLAEKSQCLTIRPGEGYCKP